MTEAEKVIEKMMSVKTWIIFAKSYRPREMRTAPT